MTADPILSSARYVVRESLAELRKTIEGVPVEALNWRPAGDDSNSLAVLVFATPSAALRAIFARSTTLCGMLGARTQASTVSR